MEDPLIMLNAANAASNGKVDPKTVVNVAQSAGSVDEATTNIAAIAHAGNIVKLYDTMKAAEPSAQASGWDGLTPAEQESLKSIGYQPPNLHALGHAGAGGEHGNIWSSIASGVTDSLHAVGHVATDVPHALSDTLNAAGAPLRGVQHLYRAGNALAEIGMHQQGQSWQEISQKSSSGGVDPTEGWNLVGSPSAWEQAWHMTNNGNTTLDPSQNHTLVDKYGQKQVSLAIQVANQGADAVVQGAPQGQRQALMTKVQDPKFLDLVTQVSNARVSIGRLAVGSAYMDQHPTAGKVLSGGIDAGVDIMSDPTKVAGRAVEAAKIARFGITDSSAASDLIRSNTGVDLLARRINPLLEQGRYGELGKVDPRLEAISSDLHDMNVDSGAKFKDYLANKAGQAAIMSGRAAKISHGVAILPHLTYLGWMKTGVKEALSNTMDRLADGKVDADLSKIPLGDADVAGKGEGVASHADQVQNAVDLLNKGKIAGGHGRIAGVLNPARLVRRTSTLVPSKTFINIADTTRDEDGIAQDTGPDITNFKRYVQGFLPAKMTDQLSNLFLDSDEGERRQLVTAAIHQNFHAQGLYNTSEGGDAADAWAAATDDVMRKQAYSVDGLDTLTEDDGFPTKHALLETQKAKGMAIPMPSVVRKMVRDHGVLSSLGVNPMNLVDKAMNVWRASVLDRLGFAGRMALDENGNRLLRLGPKGLVGSFLASGAAQTRSEEDIAGQVQREIAEGSVFPQDAEARAATLKGLANKPILPYHPAERAFQILSDHAPEGMRPFIDTPAKWYGAVFGGLARRWARQAERKAFGMEKYINAATDLATHQPVMEAADEVLARGMGGEGFGWSPESQVRQMKMGGKAVIAKFNPRAPFSTGTPGDFGYNFKWQVGLDQIANSKLGRAALETMDQDRPTAVQAVKGVLNDSDFSAEKKGFVWSKQLRNDKRVGVDATQDEADEAFARQIVDHVRSHLTSGVYKPSENGSVLHTLVDDMLSTGSAPDMETLEGIDGRQLPNSVYGPDVVPTNPFSGFFSRTFEEMVGKPMNWMARQPHFIHQYADALEQTRPTANVIKGITELSSEADKQDAEKLASDLASQRAVNSMIPYIHNPELRTQFEDYHRNLFPFLFAQRQFLQRWGRTFADSPSAIRNLQLTMNGLRTSGIVKRDQNGNDYFYYPGSQYVTEMITSTLNQIGIHATVPFMEPFTGQVKYLMPGLANPVTPSVGPFAAVGMKEFEKILPEMAGFNQAVLGQGASEGPVQQFLPSIVNRLYDAMGPAEAGSQLASTTAMFMKYLDATGHGLPNNPTRGQIETYVSRVQNGARSLLVARAMLGFTLPATPDANLDPAGLDARYKALLTQLPYEQATTEFIREHPDAVAYTVGDTQAQTEGGLPSTAEDLHWTNSNVDFTKNYPAAAPWFAPRSPGSFSLTEFQEQLDTGERQEKPLWDTTPGSHSMVTDIINARAASAYYGTVQNYESAYTNAADSATRAQLTHTYETWKADFFKRNPIFQEYIASEAGHVSRVTTMNQVNQAIKDPHLPASPVTENLKAVMETFDTFQSEYLNVTGSGSQAYDQKQTIKNNMISWVASTAKGSPDVADFLNTIILPEVDEQTG